MKALAMAIGALALFLGLFNIGGSLQRMFDWQQPAKSSPRHDQPAMTRMPAYQLSSGRSWTVACMTDGVRAKLELGERDIDVLTEWAVRRCDKNLRHYLGSELEIPDRQAAAYIRQLVRERVVEMTVGGVH